LHLPDGADPRLALRAWDHSITSGRYGFHAPTNESSGAGHVKGQGMEKTVPLLLSVTTFPLLETFPLMVDSGDARL
jgi:hypothetical protein